ncbi:MAG: HIRAN domain-containing protein [Anaerovoracaceae bacterium]
MKDKSTIIVLAIFVVIGVIATRFEQVNSVPLIIGLIILYLGFILYKKGQGKEPNLIRKIKPLEKRVEEYIPNKIGKYILTKGIKDSKVILTDTPDLSKIKKFSKLKFVPEPDNKDDNAAIKVMLEDMQLGYVEKGKTRDMIHEWLNKNEPIHAVISDIDQNEKKILCYIGFYGNA